LAIAVSTGPGATAFTPYTHIAQFGRLLLGQVDQPRLAAAVGHPQGTGAQAGDRGDVDHAAAAVLQHHARAGLRAEKRAGQVDGDDAGPFLGAGVEYRLEHGGAGVVDQGVDAAEARHYLGDACLHLVIERDVTGQRQHPLRIAEAACRLLQHRLVDIEQRDPGSLRREIFAPLPGRCRVPRR